MPEFDHVKTDELETDVGSQAERDELETLAAIERRRALVDAHNAKVSQ